MYWGYAIPVSVEAHCSKYWTYDGCDFTFVVVGTIHKKFRKHLIDN
jgi:hypothetical protein